MLKSCCKHVGWDLHSKKTCKLHPVKISATFNEGYCRLQDTLPPSFGLLSLPNMLARRTESNTEGLSQGCATELTAQLIKH